jgi:hypothetical protein
MCICLQVTYMLLLSDLNETSIWSAGFRKNAQISNFMTHHPVGAVFHVDGQTDIMKLIVAFHNFGNTPKNRIG